MTVYERVLDDVVVERTRPVDGGHLDHHYARLAERGAGGWRVEGAPPDGPEHPAEADPPAEDTTPDPDDGADAPAEPAPRVRRGRGRSAVPVIDTAPEG